MALVPMASASTGAVFFALVALMLVAPAAAGPRWTYYGCLCHNTWTFNDTTALYPQPANRTNNLIWTVLGECTGDNSASVNPQVYSPTPPKQRGYTPPAPQTTRWCYVQMWSCKAALPHFQFDPVAGMWWDYCSCRGNGKGSGAQAGCFYKGANQAPVTGWVPAYNNWPEPNP